jgi:hypothetical protein
MLAFTVAGARNSPAATRDEQLALGEAVLHQARMDVDGARKRNAVDRELLLVHAPSRAAGEQHSDQPDQTDDETQPNHSPTRE